MSRVIEDTLVRREIAYQVIGGTKFYERAEIKDAIAYLSLLANPFDVVSFTRVANSPAPRARADLARARDRPRRRRSACSVWEAAAAPEQVPGLGAAAVKALRRFMDTMGELRELAASERPGRPSCSRRCSRRRGYVEALEAERTIEAQGRIENLEQLVEVGREFDAAAADGGGHARRVPAADRAGRRRRLAQRRRGPRDADDAAQRQGPRVPDRVHRRLRGRRLPALARARRGRLEEERRLFYVGVTRAMRAAVPHLRPPPRGVRRPDATACAAASSTRSPPSCCDEPPERPLRAGCSARCADPCTASAAAGRAATARSRAADAARGRAREPARRRLPAFRLGEDVVHAAFGEGVVTGVEPGGVIVVRFAGDGSERKLMAEYAPVSRR